MHFGGGSVPGYHIFEREVGEESEVWLKCLYCNICTQ